MNPFESGERRVIPATLVYLFCEGRILMIHRIKKDKDIHEGKWNGLGGKLELEESPAQAAVREIEEECGLQVVESQLESMGYLTFPSFKAELMQDWICFVFRAMLPGRISDYRLRESNEGYLEWIDPKELLSLPLWDGDRDFIPLVIKGQPFWGTYWYRDKKLIDHKLCAVKSGTT